MEDGREDSGTFAASDLYTTNTTASSRATSLPAATSEPAPMACSQPLTLDQDSDSDRSSAMDVSESESEPEPEPKPEPSSMSQPEPHVNGVQSAGAKRPMSDEITDASSQTVHEPSKKPRLSSSTPGADPPAKPKRSYTHILPAAYWQQVFLYLPPAILSRLLRVSRDFNTYLTATKAAPGPPGGHKGKKSKNFEIRQMDSNDVWATARRVWFPNLPRPLASCNELQMLQLVGGCRCQFCLRLSSPSASPNAPSVFNAGPGLDGVRVIWPFGIRSCGNCLQPYMVKDVQLLMSPTAPLRGGLPYILITPDLNIIPESQRQQPGGIPNQYRATKMYFTENIGAIVKDYESVQEYGEATAAEWRKGLQTKGKEAMTDASRWEKWELQLRAGSDLSQVLREYDLSSFPNYLAEAQRRSVANQSEPPAMTGNGIDLVHALPPTPQTSRVTQSVQPAREAPYTPHGGMQTGPSCAAVQHLQGPPGLEPARQPQDVEERRHTRRQEIVRRCMELDPPLEAHVLPYMESFRAAMQIVQPMTDQAWNVLKPRILAQREAAEHSAHWRAVDLAALQATIPSRSANDTSIRQGKDVYDRSYDLAQDPLRQRLVQYVDEHVNSHWNGNPHLDHVSAASFAAQTILHVYNRYQVDKAAGLLPPGGDGKTSDGHEDGSPVTKPFLSLDNMKWLFEKKISQYTDKHGSLLFVCAGCVEENESNPKPFAFESLIQHYGAKHTTSFSHGNVVVRWQTSEWPEDPPFHLQPERWMNRPDTRKSFGHRDRGQHSHTPQAYRDARYHAPGTSHLSTYNVHGNDVSNGYFGGTQGHPTYPYGQNNHQTATYGPNVQNHYPPPRDDTNVLDADRVDKLAADAREVWDQLEDVSDKELLTCVRIQTVLHHANSRSLEKFKTVPDLDHYTDALATQPSMQPIKTASGLACKQCVDGQTDGSASYRSYYARIRNVKLFNISTLITHYQLKHLPSMPHSTLTSDMLEIPEMQLISDLVCATGMDDNKLKVVAEAFPGAFPSPLPPIASLISQAALSDAAPAGGAGMANKLFERYSKKRKAPVQSKKKANGASSGTAGVREGIQESLPPVPLEHEYDPRKPLTSMQDDDDDDAARFDSDIARKKASTSVAPRTESALGLAPETLRAIQALGLSEMPSSSHDVQQARVAGVKMERAPSVGRDLAPGPAPAVPSSASSTNVQPDIAAILASLTGGLQQQQPPPPQQVATPTGSGSRDGTVSRHAHDERVAPPIHHDHVLSNSYGPGQMNANTAYPQHQYQQHQYQQHQYQPQVQPVRYRQTAEPPTPMSYYEGPGQDLHAALERNAGQYAHNQAQPRPYAAEPPSLQHRVSPPRIRYVYEDGQPAPVQYAQRAVPPQQYQPPLEYQQPQRRLYVDEYGREVELIPIEPQQYGWYEPGPQQGYFGGGR